MVILEQPLILSVVFLHLVSQNLLLLAAYSISVLQAIVLSEVVNHLQVISTVVAKVVIHLLESANKKQLKRILLL